MASLLIVGQSDRVYMIRRSHRDGDELVCIKFDEITNMITQKVDYKQKDTIL
jgi:hypothetical protein